MQWLMRKMYVLTLGDGLDIHFPLILGIIPALGVTDRQPASESLNHVKEQACVYLEALLFLLFNFY